MALRHGLFTLIAALVAACGSVPMSTMVRGAVFNEENLSFVDARALRVKVSLPKGYALDVARTRLLADINSTTGQRKLEFTLDSIATTEGKRGGGMMSKEVDVTTVEMDLPDESVKALRELQHLVVEKKVKDVALRVNVTLSQAPPDATSVKVWIEMMLSGIEDYFPLIDGATIPLNVTTTYGAGAK